MDLQNMLRQCVIVLWLRVRVCCDIVRSAACAIIIGGGGVAALENNGNAARRINAALCGAACCGGSCCCNAACAYAATARRRRVSAAQWHAQCVWRAARVMQCDAEANWKFPNPDWLPRDNRDYRIQDTRIITGQAKIPEIT